MNISSNNIVGNCNLKCDFTFNYSNSGCVATNSGSGISLSYDKTNNPPVTYNGNKYQVNSIVLLPSSTYLYNNSRADAELTIMHVGSDSGNKLNVVIPIVNSPSTGQASAILSNIINILASQAPNSGQKTTVNLSNYSLNNIIPKQPFYSFSPAQTANIIVYGLESAIALDVGSLSKLKSLFPNAAPPTSSSPNGHSLYYNPNGPSNSSDGSGPSNDIYIDCQPIDESEETVNIGANKLGGLSNSNFDFNEWIMSIFESVIFQSLMLAIVLLIVLYVLRLLVQYVSKMPV
jgi:carbonic anhydrase